MSTRLDVPAPGSCGIWRAVSVAGHRLRPLAPAGLSAELSSFGRARAFETDVGDGRGVVVLRGDRTVVVRITNPLLTATTAAVEWTCWPLEGDVTAGRAAVDDRTSRTVVAGGIRLELSLSGDGRVWLHASGDLRTWFGFGLPVTVRSDDRPSLAGLDLVRFEGDVPWRVVTGTGASVADDLPRPPGMRLAFVIRAFEEQDVESGGTWGSSAGRVGPEDAVVLVGAEGTAAVRIQAAAGGFGRRTFDFVWVADVPSGRIGDAPGATRGSGTVDAESREPWMRFGPFAVQVSTADAGRTYVHFDRTKRWFVAIAHDTAPDDVRPVDPALEYDRSPDDATWTLTSVAEPGGR